MVNLIRVKYGKSSTCSSKREYRIDGVGPVGTISEYKKKFPNQEFNIIDHNEPRELVNATIYYGNLPHPEKSKVWSKLYNSVHFDEGSTVRMPRSFFNSHYRMLPQKEPINPLKIEESMEKIFSKYNYDSLNPLGTTNGQAMLRSKGIRHTSMSVGDVIKIKSQYYIVAGEGFKRLNLVI